MQKMVHSGIVRAACVRCGGSIPIGRVGYWDRSGWTCARCKKRIKGALRRAARKLKG